jgi:AraC-like DNA-binding protein
VAGEASAANDLADAAILPMSDLRRAGRVRAGALAWSLPDIVTGWHRHPYHQLEYALTGVAEVDCVDGHYLLPPQQAIWIPAGVSHNSKLCGVSAVSLFLHPDDVPGTPERAQVVAVPPVLRELIAYAVRWPISRDYAGDDFSDSYFATIVHLIRESLDRALPYWLPTCNDPLIRAVIDTTVEQLSTATAPTICRSVGIAPRTLRRRFLPATGMTWSDFVIKARLLRAMTLLTSTDRTVLDIATEVGFTSGSGFNRAFRKLTGTSPAAYRRRRSQPA